METLTCWEGTLSSGVVSNKETSGTRACLNKKASCTLVVFLPGSNQLTLGELLLATIVLCFHARVARVVVSRPGTCQTPELILGFH